MEIDWFTVVAQVVNFVVLALVLKVVLYGRIIRAIEDRRESIETRLSRTEELRGEAEAELEEYRRQREDLDRDREGLRQQARDAADERRRELVEVARSEVAEQRRSWLDALWNDRQDLVEDLRARAVRGVCDAARNALVDLADADLEPQVLRAFLRRLRRLSEEEDFMGLRESKGELVVRSAWELPADDRSRVRAALHEALGDRDVEFQTDPELVCGLEVIGGGHAIAWSMRDYLEGLDEDVVAVLREESGEPREERVEPWSADRGSAGEQIPARGNAEDVDRG